MVLVDNIIGLAHVSENLSVAINVSCRGKENVEKELNRPKFALVSNTASKKSRTFSERCERSIRVLSPGYGSGLASARLGYRRKVLDTG